MSKEKKGSASPTVASTAQVEVERSMVPGAAEQPVSLLAPPGLVSILVPCCGQLEYTRLCVPSILHHSRTPFEIIFIDVGSLDGTAEYLAGISDAARVRVGVVRAATDLQIAGAVNEALARAQGEYVVLLNNDTVVTAGWLEQLTALAKLSPGVGLVGPMSNYAAPPQLVETVPYRIGPRRGSRATGRTLDSFLVDVSAVSSYAAKFRQEYNGKWLEAERLGGFCLLVKRTVLERIGPLGEWTGLGLFDSDILSAKARQAGYTLACCRDLYIHHFGTRTFAHGAPKAEAMAMAMV